MNLRAWRSLSLWLLISVTGSGLAGPEPLQYEDSYIDLHGQRYAVRIPRGYVFELVTDQLDGPRLMTFADNGDLFIGSQSGRVYRLPPPYDRPQTLISMDAYPHSVALRDGQMFIAVTDALYRSDYKPGQSRIAPDQLEQVLPIPGGRGHSSRTVKLGPDGRIYVSLGITGNCSNEYLDDSYPPERRRGGVMVLDETGQQPRWKTFASGLRNPVGFDWQPGTGVMYASNNGPDHQGFDQPPEYFSRLTPGSFHGMPWFQYDGKALHRDDCIRQSPPRPIDQVSVPVATFLARNAPMDVAFMKAGFDPRLQGDAVVALRGSWAVRPGPSRYGPESTRRHPAVVAVRFEQDRELRVDALISGFQLENGKRWARPVGVAQGPDGALYVTSDSAVNGLYRLRKKH